jgi:surfactin synthase thioesterase subunit
MLRGENMAKTTLFCIPFAGGSKTLYYPLKDKLPSHIQFKPLELPGRGERLIEDALDSIEDMVDDLANQIVKEEPETFILLGYSLGTILAYELYYKLDELGYRPEHMILCASEPIGCIDRNNNIANMTDEEFKQFIKDKGGTPEEVLAHEELWELVKPSLKNDFLAIDYYDNKPKAEKVKANISVFVGKQDKICDQDIYKWSDLTRGQVDYQFFDGGHFFINNQYDGFSEKIKLVLNH